MTNSINYFGSADSTLIAADSSDGPAIGCNRWPVFCPGFEEHGGNGR